MPMAIDPRILGVHSMDLATWTIDPPAQPYWRMYWNATSGAEIAREDGRWPLGPRRLVLCKATVAMPEYPPRHASHGCNDRRAGSALAGKAGDSGPRWPPTIGART